MNATIQLNTRYTVNVNHADTSLRQPYHAVYMKLTNTLGALILHIHTKTTVGATTTTHEVVKVDLDDVMLVGLVIAVKPHPVSNIIQLLQTKLNKEVSC